mmetsp:Transcript_12131/g.28959  ORF Transcript_12131/g.28959 Transcript_12131/m.28959 type:complete len:295 (+) Transcript_12131:60-944(+)
MLSRSASLLATLCLALCSTSTTLAQMVFVPKGEGVCVDSTSSQYDYLETTGVTSVAGCQARCTSLYSSSLRGIEYEASAQGCLCLYENGAGFPANAFAEFGTDAGNGAIAASNSTFSNFQCYSYSGGSYSLVGTGGCIDSRNDFFSFAVPFNARGTQTAATCQSACTAAGTNGLVGLDYNGECYCLYTNAASTPSVASTNGVSSNSGTGAVAGTSTFAGVICQGYEAITNPPTPPPTVNVVTATAPRAGPTGPVVSGKAPKIKAAKAPTLENRGTKLSTGSTPSVKKDAKRRKR